MCLGAGAPAGAFYVRCGDPRDLRAGGSRGTDAASRVYAETLLAMARSENSVRGGCESEWENRVRGG